jgi:hypothetical protein
MATRVRKRRAFRSILFIFLIGALGSAFFLVRPIWWDWRAKRLIEQINQSEDHSNPKGYRELLQLLDDERLSKLTGDRALAAICRPQLYARDSYPVGRRVGASVNTCCDVVPGKLVFSYSSTLMAGVESIRKFDGQGSLRSGGFANYDISKGLRQDGQVVSVSEPGKYTSRINLHFKLIPPGPSKWIWPSEAPFPQNLLPVKVYLNRGKRIAGVPVYECKFELPVNFRVVPRSELKQVGVISSRELDGRMREAFQARMGMPGPGRGRLRSKLSPETNSTFLGSPGPVVPLLRDGVVISYRNLPTDVALRAKLRDTTGKETVSTNFVFPRKAGESGTIWMLDMFDLFEIHAPGQHKGELILFTEEDVAYEDPLITNVWSGALTFPIEFTIDAPKTNRVPP